jgi:hypothetical protein
VEIVVPNPVATELRLAVNAALYRDAAAHGFYIEGEQVSAVFAGSLRKALPASGCAETIWSVVGLFRQATSAEARTSRNFS